MKKKMLQKHFICTYYQTWILNGYKYDQVQQTNKNFEHDEHLNIRIKKKIMSHA